MREPTVHTNTPRSQGRIHGEALPVLPPPPPAAVLSPPNSTPPHNARACQRKKKINAFSIYRVAGETTACESQSAGDGWLIGASIWKKSLQNSLQHGLSSHQVKRGRRERAGGGEEWEMQSQINQVALWRCRLQFHVCPSPFLIHSSACSPRCSQQAGKITVYIQPVSLSPRKNRVSAA